MATEEIRIIGKADMNDLNKKLAIAGMSLNQFNRELKKNFLVQKKNDTITNRLTGQTQTYGMAVNKAAIKSRRFKMEYLSIMFAGMALTRVFGGIVKAQMQLFGVTDMLSAMWTIVMLPVMETIVPVLMEMLEFFMNLPDSVKRFIGSFVIVMTVLGGFLMVIGQVALGIGGLVTVFAGVELSGGTLAIVIGSIVAKLTLAFSEFSRFKKEGMSTMDALINATMGFGIDVVGVFKEAFTFLKAIMTGDFETAFSIIQGVTNKFLDWIKIKFKNALKGVWGMIKELMPGWATDAITKAWNAIVDFMSDIKQEETLIGKWKVIWDKLKLLLPTWMVNLAEAFGNGLLDMVNAIDNWGDIGNAIVSNITKAMTKSVKKKGKGFLGGLVGGIVKSATIILGTERMEGKQTGGLITKNGPAILHRGERVVPKGRNDSSISTFQPTINIYTSVSNDMDIRAVADEVNRRLAPEFERQMQSRGSI